MSQSYRYLHKQYDGPVVKIKLNKYLNLPKIKKDEEYFQTIIDSYDSDSNSIKNQTFQRTLRSWSKHSSNSSKEKEKEKVSAQYTLYGFSRMKTERNPWKKQESFITQCADEQSQKDNQQLFEQCQQTNPPQAKVQFFNASLNSYVWEEVEVLDYIQEDKKFVVQKYPIGPRKRILRGQIKLLQQNDELYQKVQQQSQKRKLVDRKQKEILQNIVSIRDDQVNKLPNQISERFIRNFKTVRNAKLVSSLLEQINQHYIFAMKKCYHKPNLQKHKQKYTSLVKDAYYNLHKQQLIKNGIFLKKDEMKGLNIFSYRQFDYKIPVLKILKRKQSQNDYLLKNLNKIFTNAGNDWKMHVLYLVSEIQDNLQRKYNFFETSIEDYLESDLKKIVTRFDFQFSEHIYEFVTKIFKTIDDFYKQFELNSYSKYQIKLYGFLQLSVKLTSTKVDKRNQDNDVKFKQLLEESALEIQPTLDKVLELLLIPHKLLMDCFQKQTSLENLLFPMIIKIQKYSFKQVRIDQVKLIEDDTIDFITKEYNKCLQMMLQFNQFLKYIQPINQKTINQIFGIEPKEKPSIGQIQLDMVYGTLDEMNIAQNNISKIMIDQQFVGLFSLDVYQVKLQLIEKIQENTTLIHTKLIEIAQSTIISIEAHYSEMYKKCNLIPSDEEQFIDLKLFHDQILMELSTISLDILKLEQLFDLLTDLFCQMDDNIFQNYLNLLDWPNRIMEQIKLNQFALKQQETIFLKHLQEAKIEFVDQYLYLQDLTNLIRSFNQYDNLQNQIEQSKKLSELIEMAYQQKSQFHRMETMFSLPISQYADLDHLQTEIKPYQNLWQLIEQYEVQKIQWLTASFRSLNYQNIVQRLQQYIGETVSAQNHFVQIQDENAQSLLRGFRKSIDDLKDTLWIIEALAVEAFQEKPSLFKELLKECKLMSLDFVDDFSLYILISKGILKFRDVVVDFSIKAEKGWNLEKRLMEMQDKLSVIEIDVQIYQESYLFQNQDEVLQQFDEQLNVLNMLKSQPQIKGIIGKANYLDNKIVLIQDTLELGMKCQKSWIYLDPIFASEDIQRRLKTESISFKNVDQSFKKSMTYLNNNKILWESIDNDKLKLEFSSNVYTLEQIQKSLNIYLEHKRISFPRFYFVSDEELVEILALTKQPKVLQKHIQKCFEGIASIKFNSDRVISGFYSSHQELVVLERILDIQCGLRLGNVEQWLSDLKIGMQTTMKIISGKANRDHVAQKSEYITKWPSQSILLANHLRWTKTTEAAIRKTQKLTLNLHIDELFKELQETVNLVRRETRIVQKTTLEAMVVMEVHAKDIVISLAKQNISNINDFNWISQLRYYSTETDEVHVKMVNSTIQYGFEYLGKITRLVITALTDRCQRTLLGALQLHYGGAPEGPAGTGKSETVKDLAKGVGMPCIVFNCSDGLNYIAMGKFFKGLASSGAWCCFDEFNRIDPEVLSVVAQQIFTIQKAIKENKSKFMFEGEDISLVTSCAINVTMNPGYAGRSELPDNLKILFRPCAMMVPDYAMIAEIYLYSIGFEAARELSLKIVTCLKLCNEQLSPQEHYDFGMRALKAVLNTAKDLFDDSEEVVILTSLVFVNEPKFTQNDLLLFQGIITDLFPGIKQIQAQGVDFQELCEELNYTINPQFIEKCNQLHNNIKVRNGVMSIGQTFSGKTASINLLAKALNSLILKLNPKAVTTDQLYGKLDSDTKQWFEGVVSILIRENLDKHQPVWIVFDGPVDSLWIENLNTVLDDNKKLCLTSGEILKIPQSMCMLFEVENLFAASPATVSRCGMVYNQPLDWLIQLQSLKVKEHIDKERLIRKLQHLLDHTLAWMTQNAILPLYNSQNILVANFLKLSLNFLNKIQENNKEVIDNYLVFSLVWTFGAAMEESLKNSFNDFVYRLTQINMSGLALRFPHDQSIRFPKLEKFDFFQYCYENNKWIPWNEMVPPYELVSKIKFYEIVVPTNESIRNDFFCQTGLHFLFCGPTGTGKSLSMAKFQKFQINCSGQTDGNVIQKLIETKVNKRKRKGYYKAEEGEITIFVDDLNMPYRDAQGSQPAIELLRQWMVCGGWYDLDTKEFKYMCDLTFLAAMQPSSGGRNQITLRYLRYFNLLYIAGFDNQSIYNMLNVFADWVFLKLDPIQDILQMKQSLINNTILLFEKVQSTLLPTPTKSHYIYNVRDLFKVFEGISRVQKLPSPFYLIKLWAHESLRIFSDRLVDDFDKKIFENILKELVTKLGFKINDVSTLIWVSFIEKKYEEASQIDIVKKRLQQIAEDFNNTSSTIKYNLILFNNAILHVVRITRSLITIQGHMLLIGMGGSGRSSLSKLANFIVFNKQLQQIDQRCWDEQLLGVLKQVGLDNQKPTLLFNDTQFQLEYMLEDVCNLMTHGEVPHLITPEERVKISEEMAYPKFLNNCKLNIHIILCMQPIGGDLRRRLRMFPSIINCTTIDWFMKWPDEALESTAKQFLPSNLVQMAIDSYHKILEINERYQQELRRYFYVTPTQYLQMLNTYSQIQSDKTEQSRKYIDKFENGVDKIVQTEKDVDKIRNVLFELQPKLEKANIENLILLNNIQKNQKEADIKRKNCEQDELQCNQNRIVANELRDICQTQLNSVLPLLSKATEALDKISKDDMILLKSFSNPPPSASVVMEGLCYAFQEDDRVKPKNKEAITTQDYWDYAKKYLLNDKLIKRIKKMKLDEIRAIHPAKIQKLKVFVQNPLFDKERVFNASSAAGNLSEWVRAVLETYQAVEIIEPKKALLNEAELKLKQAEAEVKLKKIALDEAQEILHSLSLEYEQAKKEKDAIQTKVDQIQAQLNRAEKLTYGLGEEKQRWKKRVTQLKQEKHCIEADCMLSASIISYFGVFPIQYREMCFSYWKQLFRQQQVPFTEDYSIQKHLSDPILINQWIQQKLPNDQFSIDNAIIMKQSTRWPLMIDPQIQANQWIKNMESQQTLLILNATPNHNSPSQQIELQLEHAIQIGYAVILENVGETIDPLFEQILLFQMQKRQQKAEIKFGDKYLEYSNEFRFYLTTKLPNPHYQPQVCLMVTMLNFQVTLEGLTDQMINIVVKMDEPQKEDQRTKNIQQFFINKNRQVQTQDLILRLLSEAVGDLLENETLIETLQKSKEEGLEIEERLKKLSIDAQIFNQIREFYRKAAESVANLYFVVYDMSMVEPTYQWSLEFYKQLYSKAIKEALTPKSKRINSIIEKFTYLLYTTLNRSLLEKDRLIFRFLLCSKIVEIPIIQIRTCVIGPSITETDIQMPSSYNWLTRSMWIAIADLQFSFKEIFGWLCEDFLLNFQFWETFYQSQSPHKLPIRELDIFHCIMIIKIIRPDQFIHSINEMIKLKVGKQFLENIPSTFETYFQESTNLTPFLCIVTPGADPRNDITTLAEKLNFQDKFNYVSLGQGQGQVALKLIKQAAELGEWVLLQNCHVATSFMPELERFQEQSQENKMHQDFRLWLTTLPTDLLPLNVVLKSIKMTYELPRGLKNNMLRSYYQQDPETFEECKQPNEFKNLLFSLTLFHACVLERRKYGALGWNIPYNFSQHDLEISKEHLRYFLDYSNEIQWDALHYLISETNYGGRVTDPEDRKLLNVILSDFLNPQVLVNNYKFTEEYQIPAPTTLKNYINHIHQFPIHDLPAIFGLHQNAEVYSSILETQSLSSILIQLLPRTLGVSNLNPEQIIRNRCREIIRQLPELFDIEKISQIFKIDSENSLDTLLLQELTRFNRLNSTIRDSLNTLIKGLEGHIHITEESQEISNKLLDNQVPTIWSKVSYPSSKPLGSWINDFLERLKFMIKWITEGQPITYWLGAFYFIQGFLTAQLQNHSRKHKIAIDQFSFDYQFESQTPTQNAENGFYVRGIFINGAKYGLNIQSLEEPDPKVLFHQAPIIQFLPTTQKKYIQAFQCPLYNTPERRGALTTTGYSINFIIHIDIPIRQTSEYWIKRGVAMILQAD